LELLEFIYNFLTRLQQMSKFWFIIISQILAAFIVFFTTDNIFNKKKVNISQPKRLFPLTKKGIILSVLFLFIIGLSIWQEVDDQNEKNSTKRLNEAEIAKRDSIAIKLQNYRDSIAFLRLQESKKETIEALAQYGLKYDTSQKIIEKLIKDSSRVMIVKGVEPLIKFCATSPISFIKSDNIDSVIIKICNEGAVSRNITMRFFLFVAERDDYDPYKSLQYLFEYRGLISPFALGTPEWRNFSVAFEPGIEDLHLFVLVAGSYTNSDASKTFVIDDAIYFDFKQSQHRFPVDRGKKLKDLLETKGIKL
jgi:hypothetical protein